MAEHARPAVAGAGALCVRVELVRVRLVRCVLSRWQLVLARVLAGLQLESVRSAVSLLRDVAGAEHGAQRRALRRQCESLNSHADL